LSDDIKETVNIFLELTGKHNVSETHVAQTNKKLASKNAVVYFDPIAKQFILSKVSDYKGKTQKQVYEMIKEDREFKYLWNRLLDREPAEIQRLMSLKDIKKANQKILDCNNLIKKNGGQRELRLIKVKGVEGKYKLLLHNKLTGEAIILIK